jgi:hypothetical protein
MEVQMRLHYHLLILRRRRQLKQIERYLLLNLRCYLERAMC